LSTEEVKRPAGTPRPQGGGSTERIRLARAGGKKKKKKKKKKKQ
jgi:hypothetical protein